MRRFDIYRIYPGTIWLKRLGHIAMVYGIGLNLFLGNIQDRILIEIETGVAEIESQSKVLQTQNFPDLDFMRIEKGGSFETFYNWIRDKMQSEFDTPLISVDRINEIADLGDIVHQESKNITNYITGIKESLTVIVKIINITSFLIWIPIIWSLIWLYCDIIDGRYRRFVKICLLIAIPINIIIYKLLSNYLFDIIAFTDMIT
ncbi:MAG: hypothetical protein AAGB24_05750 [Bacteroidota bacterium]